MSLKRYSLRRRINRMCHECMGGKDQPGAKRMVRFCTSFTCPLWEVRPWQKDPDSGELVTCEECRIGSGIA